MSSDHNLRYNLRATLILGVPLVLAQLAQIAIGMTDTLMLGWLGTTELAAGTLAFQLFFIFLIVGIAFGAAMVPLIANALGRDDPRSVRRASRMGLWVLVALALGFMLPLWFTKDILLMFGQGRKTGADGAELYAYRTVVDDSGLYPDWPALFSDKP